LFLLRRFVHRSFRDGFGVHVAVSSVGRAFRFR
jgi:hypothetical protein